VEKLVRSTATYNCSSLRLVRDFYSRKDKAIFQGTFTWISGV